MHSELLAMTGIIYDIIEEEFELNPKNAKLTVESDANRTT